MSSTPVIVCDGSALGDGLEVVVLPMSPVLALLAHQLRVRHVEVLPQRLRDLSSPQRAMFSPLKTPCSCVSAQMRNRVHAADLDAMSGVEVVILKLSPTCNVHVQINAGAQSKRPEENVFSCTTETA